MYKRKGKRKADDRREQVEQTTTEESAIEPESESITQPTPLPLTEQPEPTEAAVIDDEDEEQSAPAVMSKRSRIVTAFTDQEEDAIIEFLQSHPEIYDKEHERYADKYHKEALWVKIAKELKLDVNDVKRWYTSKRTTFGKVSKTKSGQAPATFTSRQKWVFDRMSFMRCHIRRKGDNRTAGLDIRASNSINESTRSSTDTEAETHLPLTSTPISTGLSSDPKLMEHFDQLRNIVSKFVEKPVDERTLFFDFVASEAIKLTPEQYHIFKGQVFTALQNATAINLKPVTPSPVTAPMASVVTPAAPIQRQISSLPRRTATVTSDAQTVGILPTSTAPSQTATFTTFYTNSPYPQDDQSRHNMSFLNSLPDFTGQITDVVTPQQIMIQSPAPSMSQQPQQQQQLPR